jgi:hypothetical protein
MLSLDELEVKFGNAISGGGLVGADRLCAACVAFLGVDGAALSLHHRGVTRGTFGSSGDLSRQLDELQFTFGEGPCRDSVAQSRPILVADLRQPEEARWPAFASTVLELGVRAVFALPVQIDNVQVGALDLFRHAAGPLSNPQLVGGLLAAKVAELPLLQLINEAIAAERNGERAQANGMATLARVEVYQATGMIMGRLDVGPEEALIRLRGHAFAHNMTASEVAWEIVERRLTLDDDDPEGVTTRGKRA